jgi:hypothetical protein
MIEMRELTSLSKIWPRIRKSQILSNLFSMFLILRFQQTILGFNCVTRLEYSAAEGHICVFFESDNFGSWMDATSGNLEAKLGEEFGDSLENLDDRGFALKIPTPEGITGKKKRF